MSFLGDSRRGRGGPGILPLQHHSWREEGIEVDDRRCVAAARIVGRDPKTFVPRTGEGSVGDLGGALCWPASTRETPAWSWCFPSIVPSSVGTATEPTLPSGAVTTNLNRTATDGGGGGGEGGNGTVAGERPVVVTQAHYNYLVSIGLDPIFDQSPNPANINFGKDIGPPAGGAGPAIFLAPGAVVGGGKVIVGVGGPGFVGAAPLGNIGLPLGNNLFGIGLNNLQVRFVLNPDPGGNPVNVLAKKNKDTEDADGAEGAAGGAGQQGDEGPIDFEEERFRSPVLPLRGDWTADRRFLEIEKTAPDLWPDLPRGYGTLTVAATDEDRQSEMVLPVDPRLVAPHRAGPSTLGTPVADVMFDSHLDPTHHAPLQTALRVVRRPTGSLGALKTNGRLREPRNSLALVIGPTGLGDSFGGLLHDGAVLGTVDVAMGGPYTTGGIRCAHYLGRDGDGTPIKRGHLVTSALFFDTPAEDGPILFEHYYPEYAVDLTWPVKCHLAWRGSSRKWEIWTTAEIYTPNPRDRVPSDTPPDDPRTPVTPSPNGPGDDPTGQPIPGWDTPTKRGRTPADWLPPGQGPWPGDEAPDPGGIRRGPGSTRNHEVGIEQPSAFGGAMTRELMLPSLTFRPQDMSRGATDFRYSTRPRIDERQVLDETVPTTLRLESWGAQYGSASAPTITDGHGWRYTKRPGQSRSPGGSASGGLILLPSEVDMSHIGYDFAPPGVTTSSVFFIAGPGAGIGVGLPDLSSGGVRSGVAMSRNGSDLRFTRYGSDGSAGNTVDLLSIAEVKTISGADFNPGAVSDPNSLGDIAAEQTQIGVRTDGGNESIQINIGGTVFIWSSD